MAPVRGMQNVAGEFVDLYLPRHCCATNKLIGAKDHAAIQFNIAKVNEEGTMTGDVATVAISGEVRAQGESNDSIELIAINKGFIPADTRKLHYY